jgi:Skp family chaperone for outer membrane proteins
MKTSLFLLAATMLPGIFLMQASGGPNVVVVDFERAVSDAPGGKDAITKITTYRNEQLAAIAAKQKEVDEIETRLRVQARTLTDDTRTQLTRNLETTRTTIQTMGEEAQKKIGEMQDQLITPIEQKTAMAVNAYANERGVKIVLDAAALQNGLVYVHPTADITTEIVRRIASDLRNPTQQDASLRLLNRKWLEFDLRN